MEKALKTSNTSIFNYFILYPALSTLFYLDRRSYDDSHNTEYQRRNQTVLQLATPYQITFLFSLTTNNFKNHFFLDVTIF